MFVIVVAHTLMFGLYPVQLQDSFYVLPYNNVPLHCSSRLPWLPLEPCVLHMDLTIDWSNARADELVRHEEYRQIKVVQCLLVGSMS